MSVFTLRNPHTLPMVIELTDDGEVKASFPALPGCEGTAFHADHWRARDVAILNCARAIVAKLEME